MASADPRDLLAEAREELNRADAKAALLLSALAVAVGIVAAALLAGDWSPDDLSGSWRGVWWGGAALAGVGMVLLAMAVWPRLKHRVDGPRVTYFHEIAEFRTVEDLRRALDRIQDADRALVQLLAVSKILKRKYRSIRWAMLSVGMAIGLVVVVGIAGS